MGRKVDIKDYFKIDGDFKINIQRENEYTRMLERSIVDKFHTHNTILTSNLVAFTAFILMRKMFEQLDLYAFLRLPNEDTEIKYADFEKSVEKIREQLFILEKNGKILLSEEIRLPINELIQHGLKNLGMYHTEEVLHINENGNVVTGHKKLLYYYHNRALGYQLEKYA
jgi:glycerol-3-phosphate O-acyltransferase